MKLTDTFYTDATNASSSLIYDLNSNEWSKKILDLFDISEKILPDVLPSSEIAGRVNSKISEISGLKAGTPVIVGTGDIGANNISAGIINVGQGIIRFGTCATISVCTNEPLLDNNDKCPCSSYSIPGLYLIQGTSASFGDSIRWLKNTFYPDMHVYDLMDKEGIFISQFRGKQKYFFLNKTYPLFNELKSIIFKTIGIKGSLQNIINETSGIVSAFIYGSFATGKENVSSDIDLCLIVKDSVFNENNFISKINKLGKTISREINYIYYSEDEWEKQTGENDSFIINIKMSPKIVLKGDKL